MSKQNQPKDSNWPKDEFGQSEIFGQLWWVLPVVFILVGTLAFFSFKYVSGMKGKQVVAYCAQDQVYAEPIFHQFEKESGIKVRAVYDSEAVKTVGLANRLLAERSHPQCDVFWGNEEMRTRQLAAQSVFRETNGWVAFGYRSRRIVINTNQISVASAPRSLLELTNETWRGKVVRLSDWYTHRRSMLQEPLQFNDVRTLECIVQLDPGQSALRIGQRVRVTLGAAASSQ